MAAIWSWCWCWPAWIIYFHCWFTSGNQRMDGEVQHWVLGSGSYWLSLLLLRTNSILWCVVKTTKVAIWSHPSALLSMIGTKLSGVRGCSFISCRVVITSSWNNWNVEHSVCHALSSRALWSHPSALLSKIGTKLSGVRGCSFISCRVVVTSSWNNWNVDHSECARHHHLELFYRSCALEAVY